MNKTLAITAIVLVAVVMGMSAIAPAMAWEAEPDSHKPKACAGIANAIENGGKVPVKVIIKLCS